jgi:hypothetical protein
MHVLVEYNPLKYQIKNTNRFRERESTRSTDSFLISSRLIGLSPLMAEAGDES